MNNVARPTSYVLRRLAITLLNLSIFVLAGCGGHVNHDAQTTEESGVPAISNPPSEQPEPVEVTVPPAASSEGGLNTNPPDLRPQAPYINAIEFQHDPDEAAVPKGAASDDVEVVAWYLEAHFSQKVPANWTWTIDDLNVAQFLNPGTNESSNRLITNIDVFDSPDQNTEPFAELMACAIPESAPPNTMDPVCGTLPVATVVNMAGHWECQGTPDGDITITQIGRWLTVNGTGRGTVYSREVDFYLGDYQLHAELSDREHMSGTYWKGGTTQVLGTWSASLAAP